MSVAAEAAVRAWINARPITAAGQPLANGAYFRDQRSPAGGAYAVIARGPDPGPGIVAEDSAVTRARIQAYVYAGTVEAAESAASALRGEFETLTGVPEPCGDTGVLVLVADNHTGPVFVPQPADTGENYCFQVGTDLLLTD